MSYLTWCQNCVLLKKYSMAIEEDRLKMQPICLVCIFCNYNSPKGGCHNIVVLH